MEWQPIETAPMDEDAYILVYPAWNGGTAANAKWNKYGKFWEREGAHRKFSINNPPTHWMPHPPPPDA